MSIPLCVVDAFASRPFRGNPAAVCVLPGPADAGWMQEVAGEMHLSETSFLSRREDGGWDLRWFTPVTEVNLCGHATMAAAHALWDSGRLRIDEAARFTTKGGVLTCTREPAGIRMDFPVRPAEAVSAPSGLAQALGADVRWCGRTDEDLLVELPHAATLRALQPDLWALAQIPVRGVIVTAPSDVKDFDFVSRFFAPVAGIPEDPVTGSAHCSLAAYWAPRLGRRRLRGWQASRRGGDVGMEWVGDRVFLTGKALTVWRGELLVGPGF